MDVGRSDVVPAQARAAAPALGDSPADSQHALKRSLSFWDLLVYGLLIITPTGPWSTFGFVFNASHGMVPLVYAVGFVAMSFTALSYATMSAAFPTSGSVYAYVAGGVGETAGFLAGWTLLLDYLLSPTLLFVICAVAVHSVIPAIPKPLLVMLFVVLNTAISLLGIEDTARLGAVLLTVQLILLAVFVILGLIALAHGMNGAHLSWAPLYDPQKVSSRAVLGALSLAVLSFLGFDAISTLAEEAKGGARSVGNATLLSLLLTTVLFMGQTYLASLFVLNREAFAPGAQADTAFYAIAQTVGGMRFRFVVSILGVFLTAMPCALNTQIATSRLIYSMARDGKLPRILARVSVTRRVPHYAIILIAVVTLVLGTCLVDHLELLTSMVNFGALTGFLALHLSVITHFTIRRRSRDWPRHLVAPLCGFVIIAYVLINAQTTAKIAGLCWMTVGVAFILTTRIRSAST
ncbi:APC family permease [Sphingomonas sp. CL5.1]|uniref:APC family permease n=1 Tax=Sphingomonas sp. CL5.1 TaxID=2653203 RepID=UPI0015840AD7|nr:APC family permease [Sphingomonas sp. CL5.1]QKS00467.1 APC family permease [Sphingomonas sp. CL5.1]